MTQEDYKSELKVLSDQISAAKKRKMEIREAFLKGNAAFRRGDIVEVTVFERPNPFNRKEMLPEIRTKVWIKGVHDDGFIGKVQYSFGKIKKDGSKSVIGASIGVYDRIELIQKAEPDTTQPLIQ